MLLPFQTQRVTTRSLLTQGVKSVSTTSLIATLMVSVSLPVFADSHESHYGKIELGKSEYEVEEGQRSISIWAMRMDGNSGQMMVKYGTTGASAKAGEDYVPTSGTLTWADGDKEPKEIMIQLHDDQEVEDPEMFYVTLLDDPGNPSTTAGGTPQNFGKRITAKVHLKDNDKKPSTTTPPATTGIESGMQIVTFQSVVIVTKTVFTAELNRFRFGPSIWKYRGRSANGENFFSAFGESLAEFGLDEFYVEGGAVLIPDTEYLSWLSAYPGELTTTDETETGLFTNETTGMAYLVYNDGGSNTKIELYPALAPTIVEGLMELFPEATLAQSAQGLAFTLDGTSYYFTTPYVALVKGFDLDPFTVTEIDGGLELCNAGLCQAVYAQ
jgi:hypothetical protein